MFVGIQRLSDLRNKIDCRSRQLWTGSALWAVAWIKTNIETRDEELDLRQTYVSNLLECRSFLALELAIDGLAAIGERIGDKG